MLPWLLYSLLAAFVAADCPANFPAQNCYSNTLFVLDATNYLTNVDINNELNFTMNNVLPRLGFPQQQATIVSFGSGSEFTPLTSIYGIACAQFINLIGDINTHGGQRATLTSTMNQIYQDYRDFIGPGFNIQLFSGSTDTNDINSAASFVRNNMRGVQFTVVSLSNNGAIWSGFPYQQIYVTYPWLLDYNLGACLVSNSCGFNACQAATTTTPRPTTTTPTTTTSTTTVTTPQPYFDGPQCQCNYNTSWNDIMFLFESSSAVGFNRLQELLGYVQTSLTYFNVQLANQTNNPYHTRIGMISYSDSAVVNYRLGTLDWNGLQSITQLPYQGGIGTNLNLAFQYATNELFGAYSRPNARPVIVVLGQSYSSSSYPMPQQAADSFRRAGGVVIVYDFIPPAGSINPTLQALTSSGYFITNSGDNGHRLQDALCDANCKCSTTGQAYSADPSTGKPTSGCFTAVETLGNFQVATNKCNLMGGAIAEGKTADVTIYLESLFSIPSSFLAGMKWDSLYNIYRWVDGTPVTGWYQPWYNNQSNHQSGRDCVYVYNINGLLQWVPTDCRNGFFYACQTKPCDSTNYCY